MAPIWLAWLTSSLDASISRRQPSTASSTTLSDLLAAQWQNPGDILSVLLLIGPDVIHRAVAQLAGRAVTPVAFSFGWVAYAVSALLSSFGDGRLMPDSDTTVTVIDANSGHGRESNTWILGRLLRDFNKRLDEEMRDEQPHISSDASAMGQKRPAGEGVAKGKPWNGLTVAVFEVEDEPYPDHGVPKLDWVWYSAFVIIVVQLGIAAVPWAVDGQWATFVVTGAGNILALIGGSLPQWRREKWACPKEGGDTVVITEGNGSRSAMVILKKKGVGLKFEVLARGTRTAPASMFTRVATAGLAALWIVLLITVAGLQDDTWYLLGIGVLGSIQNLVAAGVSRSPAAIGIHIRRVEKIGHRFVADTLREVEERYPLVGTSMLDVFFPGSLRVKQPDDIVFWRAALQARYGENRHGTRLDRLPQLEIRLD